MVNSFEFKWYLFLVGIAVMFFPVWIIVKKARKSNKVEQEKIHYKVSFIANNLLLYLLIFMICLPTLICYYNILLANINKIVLDILNTGIILPFILFGVGLLIRWLYRCILNRTNTANVLNEVGEKTIFSTGIISNVGILWFLVEDKEATTNGQIMLSLFILALVVGRFFWVDTTWTNLKKEFSEMWEQYKTSIFIGIFLVVFMIFNKCLPSFVEVNSILSFFIGLVVGMIILIIILLHDSKKIKEHN